MKKVTAWAIWLPKENPPRIGLCFDSEVREFPLAIFCGEEAACECKESWDDAEVIKVEIREVRRNNIK